MTERVLGICSPDKNVGKARYVYICVYMFVCVYVCVCVCVCPGDL
jgi:hypothetical protein